MVLGPAMGIPARPKAKKPEPNPPSEPPAVREGSPALTPLTAIPGLPRKRVT